ncbi:hypothetical protein [Thalassomonas sp. RHCl1]|uniref:hypothetical protein n=1 Tax=Thalassomonas sp. RHCl1 TaxID=2995320 RepID=UPI00248BDA60|nr:hypothetical protein [Thalassomonas sp. RHCl1]
MNTIELAKKYLDVFFKTQEFDSLYEIFDEELDFKGPFLQSYSAKAYIESLKAAPWESCEYEIREEYENSNSACITYLFRKGRKCTLMSQQFWGTNGKINKVRLIFNAADIT